MGSWSNSKCSVVLHCSFRHFSPPGTSKGEYNWSGGGASMKLQTMLKSWGNSCQLRSAQCFECYICNTMEQLDNLLNSQPSNVSHVLQILTLSQHGRDAKWVQGHWIHRTKIRSFSYFRKWSGPHAVSGHVNLMKLRISGQKWIIKVGWLREASSRKLIPNFFCANSIGAFGETSSDLGTGGRKWFSD